MFFLKKVAILANCQGGVYKKLLLDNKEFSKKFDFIDLPLVHTLNQDDKDGIYKKIKNVDILFYQPLNSKKLEPFFANNLKKHMPLFSNLISIPSLYFNFYHCHTIYILKDNLPKFEIDYHDINILLAWYYNIPQIELLAIISLDDYYQKNFLKKIAQINFNEIIEREKEVDIKYFNFVHKYYESEKLFHTFNHPANKILLHVFEQMQKSLNLKTNELNYSTNLLGNIFLSTYPSLNKFLDKKNTELLLEYNIFGKVTEQDKMIEKYYKYYDMYENEIKDWTKNNLIKTNNEIELLIIENFKNKFKIK